MVRKKTLVLIVVLFLITGCSKTLTSDPHYNNEQTPKAGQAAFPKLGQYWVIDNEGKFSHETIVWAHKILEKLRTDKIAEVVIICQSGVKDNGPMDDEKIWLIHWARWAKIGDVKDRRGLVWLIRPDVKPEQNRITVEVSSWLTWYTAIDYGPTLEEAGKYANFNNYDGCLESIVRGVDVTLRKLWKDQNLDKEINK